MRTSAGDTSSVELPAWQMLVDLATIIIGAPQDVLACTYLCREVAIKVGGAKVPALDKALSDYIQRNSRLRQFAVALSEYIVEAGKLPTDFAKRAEAELLKL